MIFNGFEENKSILDDRQIFLVCGNSFDGLEIADHIKGLTAHRFGDFRPNPLFEEVMDGVGQFDKTDCDTILAVGGGSAMDVAKAIKYYCKSDPEIIAIPTTAGTGAESTHFAVIYKDGEKTSLDDASILPESVILEPSVLASVAEYTRKVTMLDALCHSIESYWSKKATEESKAIATKAIKEILENKDLYLSNTYEGNKKMLVAANLAGQAINITTTTAAHAMSYKLTSLYGIAHGHAVALCLPEVWKINKSQIPGITNDDFYRLLEELRLGYPVSDNRDNDIEVLTKSVNIERLKNNPSEIDCNTIRNIYERIVK